MIYAVCVLIGVIVGFVLGPTIFAWDEYRRVISEQRSKTIDPKDPHDSMCITMGLTAGYYAATGEDKDPTDIVEMYTKRVNEE